MVCRRRSRSHSDGDKSLTCLPPTCLTKPQEKYTPACRSKSKRQTSHLSFSVFVFFGSFYTPALLRFSLSDCMACNQIFNFHSHLSLCRLPPFGCSLHRIASVGRSRSGAKVIPGCYAAARSAPSVLEKISTPALHCVSLRVVFSLKNLAFAHPYLC